MEVKRNFAITADRDEILAVLAESVGIGAAWKTIQAAANPKYNFEDLDYKTQIEDGKITVLSQRSLLSDWKTVEVVRLDEGEMKKYLLLKDLEKKLPHYITFDVKEG